jgi:hypothetical protein
MRLGFNQSSCGLGGDQRPPVNFVEDVICLYLYRDFRRFTFLVSYRPSVSGLCTTLDLAGSRCFQWYVSCQLNWRTSYHQKPATVFNELTYAEFVITNQAVLRILD